MTTEPYVPTVEVVRDAVAFPRERLGEPRQISREAFDRFVAKIRAEALREAAEILPAPVGLKCNAECHDADRITLRIRADRIEEEA